MNQPAGHREPNDDVIHLVCEDCGALEDHRGEFVAQLHDHLTRAVGFKARATEATVFGVCVHCQT